MTIDKNKISSHDFSEDVKVCLTAGDNVNKFLCIHLVWP